MGSSNSRLGSRPSRLRVNGTNKRFILSSLICGGSPSRAICEMEDHPSECLVKSADHCAPPIHEARNATDEPFFSPSTGTVSTSRHAETGATSGNINSSIEDYSIDGGPSSIVTSSSILCSSESKELVSPRQVCDDYSCDESLRDNSTTSTFSQEQQSSEVYVNVSANSNAVHGIDSSIHSGVSETYFENMHPSSSSSRRFGTNTSEFPVENHVNEVTTAVNSDSDTNTLRVGNRPITSDSLGNEPLEEAASSGLGFLVTNREQGRAGGGIFHMDVVSISSNFLSNSISDGSNHEARRNSRRLFCDAFSRRSSRRLLDSPTIVFSRDDPEDQGSHEPWLLGLSGEFFEDGYGADSVFFGGRIASMNERRRRSRLEIWESLRGGSDENSRRNTFCPSGLHPDDACSCESFLLNEESTTRASISRIVMLAEALFEVLNEIRRQSVPLTLSMVASPAPACVVDSFPLKSHTTDDMTKGVDGVKECYICLAEYENGDKVRVLPCHHEYHMSCVDKWLKEIHGVCPLCRVDVREGSKECSISNSQI